LHTLRYPAPPFTILLSPTDFAAQVDREQATILYCALGGSLDLTPGLKLPQQTR